jgi:hypothetical protein
MWGYQPHFQMSAEIDAERLLGKLDPNLRSRLFLVGVLVNPRPDRLPVCVVPDDCPYQPEVFDGVRQLANQHEASDPERNILRSHPVAEENAQNRMTIRSVHRAILEKIEAATDTEQVVSYGSWPVLVEDFLVVVVLQVSRSALNAHYRLQKATVQYRWTTPFSVERSLIEATISRFLEVCAECLRKPNPGAGWRMIEDDSEVLRAAAKDLMAAPTLAGGNEHGLHGLYEACNAISTLKYEGKEGVGQLVLARPDHPHIRRRLELLSRVQIREYNAVRKLLQIGSGEHCLLCDSAEVYGIGTVNEDYQPAAEDLFVVRFVKNFIWELTHAGHPLMHVRFGVPMLRPEGFPEAIFRRDLPRIFHDIAGDRVENLCQVARAVAEQEHGAMLVISSSAAEEAARLANQCTRIRPFNPDDKTLCRLTSIDGAVLLDLEGNCHAIGVILDGLASPKCTPSRGARYNSGVRYAYGRCDCMVVVKSEDGMVNVFPNLMAQIRRSDLAAHLAELRLLASAETADRQNYFRVMHWFDDHRFYLSADLCAKVNELRPQAEARLENQHLLIVFNEFAPDPDMDDSYFFQE